ncbi:hypothetical protein NXX90_03225 [Parabacteroides distasonis]|nr:MULTISPECIES: hypothetical protein [Parabacteroides]MCM0695743.1 hypothetical protein [Parabacteroides sp. B2-S-102]MCS3185771.1 hypothetical protein [Parabacteroides distasonis]
MTRRSRHRWYEQVKGTPPGLRTDKKPIDDSIDLHPETGYFTRKTAYICGKPKNHTQMRDITHFLLATLLSLATLACRHDTPPTDGPLSRQLPPGTEEIFQKLNDRDNREEALRLADSLAALPPSDDPWLEIRIAQAAANTLYKFRRDPSDAIRTQERALAVYRLHPDAADDPADLLSTLGHYYRRKGMREKEVEVIQEAMDWCVAHPEKLNRGFVYTFADLSSTYSDLGLYDKAMEAISRSIDYSLQLDSFTISDLYRMKAGIFWELEQHDSTLYYARQALKRGEEMKENAYVLAAKNILYNYYYEYVPDSIPAALEGYKELIEEEEAISAGYQDLFKFMLGACLVRDGKPEKGFPLMEEAYALYKKYEANDMMDWTGRHLLNLYAEQKKGDKMAEIYPEYKEIHDSLQLAEKQRYAIGANVRYETGRKEQENRALSAEVALKERSLVYTRVILILAICLLTGIIVYALQRRRLHQREREIQRQRLDNLLATQQELNRHNERLSAELEQAAHNEVIDSVRQKLNPSLLSGEDELRFRQSFAALYPRFLPGLRKDFPELTKSDELLCMLIYLKQSTDEISLALGISRPSVNSGRSRIRKKLGLQKEESLDEFLQKR